MKKLTLLIIGVLLISIVRAQDNDTTLTKDAHEFGIHLGSTTGMGLSYRYWPKKIGLQLTMLPIKSNHEVYLSIGVTGLYSFYNSKMIHFFSYFANNIVFKRNLDYMYSNYNPQTGMYDYTNRYTNTVKYNIGFGPGFGYGSRVRVNVMGGYGLYDVLGEFNLYPTGEIGLYFRL